MFCSLDPGRRFGYLPVMIEVRWQRVDTSFETSTMSRWMRQSVTVTVLLDRLGIMRACMTSHRCTIYLDGLPVDDFYVNLSAGSFIMVAGDIIELPLQSDSEAESPQPIRRATHAFEEPTSPSTMSHATATTTSFSGSSIEDEYDAVLALYRPPGGRNRPLSGFWAIRRNTRSYARFALEKWPELRYRDWHGSQISYYELFAHIEDFRAELIVDPSEAGPMTVVFLMITWLCPVTSRMTCPCYVNEVLLEPMESRRTAEGDFIRIDLYNLGPDIDVSHLSMEFQLPDDVQGFEQLEDRALEYFTAPTSFTGSMTSATGHQWIDNVDMRLFIGHL